MDFKFCSLASGSSGNSTYIGTDTTNILVDAGLSGKKVVESLSLIDVVPGDIDAIVVTHEHKDHIKGIGILSRRFDIPIYANSKTWKAMEGSIGEVKPKNVRCFETDQDFYIKDLNVQPFLIPHDAAEPVGYCFYYAGKKVTISTDLGHTNVKIINMLADSDILLLEANHDLEMLKIGSYPYYLKKRIMGKNGHLSNNDAGETLIQLINRNVKNVLLGHLSRENNVPELAYATVKDMLDNEGIVVGRDIMLNMTYRDKVGGFYKIR